MKTTIETLIEKITPLLPVIRNARFIESSQARLIAHVQSRDLSTEDLTALTAYLVHCANNFPKLLEALERLLNQSRFDHDALGVHIAAGCSYCVALEALTQAREVKG